MSAVTIRDTNGDVVGTGQFDNFRVEPNNILGVDFQQFRNKIIQLGLADPKAYYKLRGSALKEILIDTNKKTYDLVYNLLTIGVVGNTSVFVFPNETDGTPPNYPKNKASNEAMSVCESMNDILQDLFDTLMPPVGDKMADSKLHSLGVADGIPK